MSEDPENIIREARERGAKLKAALLRKAGGPMPANEVATLLGLSIAQVTQNKSLLAVPLDDGSLAWPRFQFESQAMMDGVEKIRNAIQVEEPWAQLNFLFLHLKELDGKMAVEAIREQSVVKAILAARHFGDHGGL